MLFLSVETDWSRALPRALDRHPDETATYEWSTSNGNHHLTVFEVKSHSEPDVYFQVELRQFHTGAVEVGCSCPARVACWHRAAVLNRVGLLLNEDLAVAA